MNFRGNKGITLASLAIAMIIILIVAGAMIANTKNQTKISKINRLRLDIENLNSKVDEYYLTYGGLPTLCEYVSSKSDFQDIINGQANEKKATINGDTNENDGDTYSVIDLEKLTGLTLNYGIAEDGDFSTIKTNGHVNSSNIEKQVYVINNVTHQIYYPYGVFVDGVMYYMF